MKNNSTIFCLAILCLLFFGSNTFSQTKFAGIEIMEEPVFTSVCAGENSQLSVRANGNGLNYQWQVQKRVGNYENIDEAEGYSGSQSPDLEILNISKSMNLYTYRCIISNGMEELSTSQIPIVLKNAIINFQPANGSGYVGDYHSIEVFSTGEGLSYQWQVDKGSGFINLKSDSVYSGCKTSILSIGKVAKKMASYNYRCIVSGNSCEEVTLYSNPASLVVSESENPMHSRMAGDPTNVVWYVDDIPQEVFFHGNPIVYVDGAIKVTNNSQILSQQQFSPSEINLTGHFYNENTTLPIFKEGDATTLNFIGGDDQDIVGGSKMLNNFYRINLNKNSSANSITLLNDISIRGNLMMGTGDLWLFQHSIYLDYVNFSFAPQTLTNSPMIPFPNILSETDDNRIFGIFNGTGIIIENQLVGNSNPFSTGLNLGNIGAEITDPTGHFGGKTITFERSHHPLTSGPENSILRTYKISSIDDTPIPAEMDFVFHYFNSEVSGGDDSNLTIFKSEDMGVNWEAQTGTLNNSANTLTQTNVQDITNWWTAFPCSDQPNVYFFPSPEIHLCDEITTTITPASTAGATVAYNWILDGDTLDLNQNNIDLTGMEGTPDQTLKYIAYNSTGCFDSDVITVIHEDSGTVEIIGDNNTCQSSILTLNAITNNATSFQWKVNGTSAFGSGPNFNFFANAYGLGDHTVEVTASTPYCSSTDEMVVTVHPKPSVFLLDQIRTCEQGQTLLTPNVFGGTMPYDYNWSIGGASSPTLLVTNANSSFSVTVTDDNGCTASDFMVMCYSNILLDETHTDINCFGDATGTIDLSVSGTFDNLLYNWSNGTSSQDINGVVAGTYTVVVTDATFGCSGEAECTETLDITLTQPAAELSVTESVTPILCNGQNTGAIDLTVNGGTLPYEYSWSNGATNQDLVNIPAGTYDVIITDAKLCTKTVSIIISEPPPLEEDPLNSPAITELPCNGTNSGAIDWHIQGGTLPYVFSWIGPNGFTAATEDLTGLFAGTYSVLVTDANDCTYSTSFEIMEPTALSAIITPENVNCIGTASGSINIDASGGTPYISPPSQELYEYNWTGPNGYTSTSFNPNIFGLESGDYNVTISDLNGCELIPPTVTIIEPSAPLELSSSFTNITCFGANNGTISTTVTGGWPPYTYSWLDPEDEDLPSTANQSFLGPGTHELILTDNNGCSIIEYFNIEEPSEIFIDPIVSQITCNNANDGSIVLNVFGGTVTGDYNYNWQWAGGSSTAGSLSNLSAGSYAVTVSDDNNCENSLLFTIINPAVINAVSTVQQISCFGYDDGSFDLLVSGGSPDYEYSWEGPNGFATSDGDLFSLAPGDYNLSISDLNSCPSFTATYTIIEPAQLTANPIVTSTLECFGDTDGQLNANPMGGTAPYTYLWTYPDLTTTATTQFTSNLSQTGFYGIEIYDDNLCFNFPGEIEIELISPPEIIISEIITPVSINGNSDGAIDLTVSGGTGNFEFLWSNMETTEDISGLASGTYLVTVTDMSGCEKTLSFEVIEPGPLQINIEELGHVSCHAGDNGFILSFASGGVSPFEFNWSNDGDEQIISNLVAGDYTLTLTDFNGAIDIETFTITEPGPISDNATINQVSCFMEMDGSITLDPIGGTGTFDYLWSNNETANSISGLTAGNYLVTITDDNFCEFFGIYTVTEPDLLEVNSTPTDATCFGYGDGSINLNINGGTPPLSYNWEYGGLTGNGSGTNIPDLQSGNYFITITDDNECTAVTSANVGQPQSLFVNISGNQNICENETSVLDAGAGYSTYEWSTSEMTQTITVNASDVYTATVSDALGCTESADIQVFVSPLPTLVIDGTTCSPDLLTYSVEVTSNGSFVESDFGTVSSPLGDLYTISGIQAGQDVTITTDSGDPPCQNIQIVTAPACTCPFVAAPVNDGDQAICLGQTIPALTVTVGTDETADWYDAGSSLLLSGSTSFTPTAEGSYFAEARNTINGCLSSTRTAVELIINDLPVATAGIGTTICSGTSTTLDASGSTGFGTLSFSWSPAATLPNPNIAAPVASPSVMTIYTVTVTDANTCSATADVTIMVNTSPIAEAGTEAFICAGANTQLDAGASTGSSILGYAWTPTAGLNDPAIADPVANPSGTTIYTVQVTDDNGCTDSDGVTVNINPLPTLALSSTLCGADLLSYQIIVNSNADALSSDFGALTDNANGTFTIAAIPTGQDVALTATDNTTNCQKDLTVNAPDCICPAISPPVSNGNQAACFGTSPLPALSVTVGPNETADWYSLPVGGGLLLSGNTSFTPSSSGVFYAETHNTVNDCTSASRTAISLIINDLPSANAGTDANICAGGSTTLNGTASSGSGTLAYLWSPASEVNDPAIASPVASPTNTTILTLTVTDGTTCSDTDEVTITVNDLPLAMAGPDVSICQGENTQLDASGSTGTGTLEYEWSPAFGLSATNIANPVASPTTSTIYTVEVRDDNGCEATANVAVNVNSNPTFTLNSSPVCAADLLRYSVSFSTNASDIAPDFGILTDDGGGSFTVSGIPAGQDLTLDLGQSSTGCMQSFMVTAPVCTCPILPPPTSNGDQTICDGSPILALTVSVGTAETADWYDAPSNGNLLLSGSTSFTPSAAGVFYAETHNTLNNCVSNSRTAIELTINPLPSANAGPDITICAGANAQLDASASTGSGSLNYLWSPATGLNNATIVNPVASPAAPTTYTIEVTDGNGCTATAEVMVGINPTPSLLVNSNLCAPNLLTYSVLASTNAEILAANFGTVTDNGDGNFTISGVPTGQNVTLTSTFTATGCEQIETVIAPDCPCPLVAAPVSNGNAEVCEGSPTPTLSVTVGLDETADWYDAPTDGNLLVPGNTNFNPTATGTYFAEGRNTINNCVSDGRTAVMLVIHDLPAANAGADAQTCVGSSVTLDASGSSGNGGLSFQWSPVASLNDPTLAASVATPNATTTYTITVTDGNSCSASDQVSITVNPLPTLAVNGTACVPNLLTYSILANTNGVLTSSLGTVISTGGNAYTISGVPTGMSADLTATFPLTGCSQSETVASPSCPCPVVNAPISGADETICDSEPVPALSVTVGTDETADWYDAATDGNLLLAGSTSFTPLAAGTYFAEGRNNINACVSSSRTAVALTILPSPTANVGADAEYCGSGSTPLDGSGSTGMGILDYTWSPASGLSDPNIAMPLASPSTTTIYSLQITDENGCTDIDQVTVTANPLPVTTFTSVACAIDLLTYELGLTTDADEITADFGTVTDNGGGSFSVTDIPAGQSVFITATVTATGCQKIEGLTAPNCSCPIVEAPLSGGDAIICAGQTIPALTATASTDQTVDWYDAPSGGTLLLAANSSFTPLIAGVFYAEARDVNNDCTSNLRTAISLTINELPSANAGDDLLVCTGENAELDADGSMGDGTLNFAWSPTVGLNDPAIANPVASPSLPTTYTVVVTDENGCSASDEVAIDLLPLPAANAGTDVSLCAGANVLLDASGSTGMGSLNFAWSPATGLNDPASPTPLAAPSMTTIYTVDVTDGNGCSATDEVTVTIFDLPVVSLGPDVEICAGSSIVLDASGSSGNGSLSFAWSPAEGLSATDIPAPLASPTATTIYTLEVTAENGCTASEEIAVAVLELPVADAGTDLTICEAASTNLDASGSSGSGALSYEWTPATGLNANDIPNPMATLFSTTTYTLAVTDGTGCSVTDEVTVTVNPSPSLIVQETFCAANLLTYSILIQTSADVTEAGTGTVTDNGGGQFSISNLPTGQMTTITVTQTSTGCQASQTVTAPNCNCPIVEAPVSGGDEEICASEPFPSLSVAVNADETADWYDAPVGGNLLLSGSTIFMPSGAGTFYAEARNTVSACVSSGRTPVALTVFVLPAANAGANVAICTGESTVLGATALSGNTFSWTPATGLSATNVADPLASPSASTTYALLVTDANGCTASDQVNVIVNSLPTLSMSNTNCAVNLLTYSVLANSNGTLTASHGMVSASGGNTFNVGGVPIGQAVTLTSTSVAGCQRELTVPSPDCPCPVVSAPVNNGNQTICEGSPFPTLTVTPAIGATTDWYDAATGGNLLLAESNFFTPSAGGTYFAEGRNTFNDCVSSTRTPVNLTVNPAPIPGAGEDVTICFGQNTSLNGGGSTGTPPLSFLWSPNAGLSNPNVPNPNASPSSSTVYTLLVSSALGCTATDEVVVTVDDQLSADAGDDTGICTGESTVLDAGSSTGNGLLNYVWSPGIGLSETNIANPTTNPNTTTTYTVTVTDETGCSGTDQVVVAVNPFPSITVNNVACDNNLVEYLVIISTNADVVTASAGSVSAGVNGTTVINLIPGGTDLTITATQSATGCSVVQAITAPDCDCPPVDPPLSNGDEAVCIGGPLPNLTVSVGSGETANWYDAPVGGSLLSADATVFSPAGAGTFYVETEDLGSGCTSATLTPISLIINDLPTANAGTDGVACPGSPVQLDGTASTGNGGLTYLWSPAMGLNNAAIANPTASPAATTTYTLTVSDAIGCSSTDEVTVEVTASPIITLEEVDCAADLLSYDFLVSTDGSSLTANAGTVTDNGGGQFSITGIPAGQDVELTVTSGGSSCIFTETLIAPDCNCPTVEAPTSGGGSEICEGEAIPTLSVLLNVGEGANWYDAPLGGNLLAANSGTYTPTGAGTFYAETILPASGCTSLGRTAVSLLINPLPIISFNDPEDICAGSPPVLLAASPNGGGLMGTGVFGNEFDPGAAGIGAHVLTYVFGDANGCVDSVTQEVEVLALPNVFAEGTSPLCEGEDLQLSESGGDAVEWAWTGPAAFVSASQNPVISSPTPSNTGIYEVTALNADGCSNTATVEVDINPAIILSISPDPAVFCPGGNVQLVAEAAGGTGLFDYVWAAPSGTDVGEAILANEAGGWSVMVTDEGGCTATASIEVTELSGMSIDFAATDASCNGSDGMLTANVSGGLPPYGFVWDGLPGSDNMQANLPAGNYQVVVTDALGCTFSALGTVGNTGAPVISPISLVDVACGGDASGSITVDVSGGLMPYTFNWSGGELTQNISDLSGGQYELEVVDATGCVVTEVFAIEEPDIITADLAATQTSGPTANDANIDLTVLGGTMPYSFLWSNGLISEDISNLFIGTYSVTISDANGCSIIADTEVTELGALAVDLISENISCNGLNDGNISLEIFGGTMPYSIIWNTADTSLILNELLAGNYQVTVTDNNGNTASGSTTLTQPNLLQSFTQMTNNICNGGMSGTANVIPSGGTSPYFYLWSNGETTPLISELIADIYTVTISDENGCTDVQTATLGEPSAMQIMVENLTDNNCFGEMFGKIDISISGGAFPYFANWSNGASTQDIESLAAGTYIVTITDFQACTAIDTVTVAEPDEIIIDFSITDANCFGEANGNLTANASGGTPGITGYSYNWTNGGTTTTIDNLISDNYFLTVTDELGCTAVGNEFVAQPELLNGNLIAENINCFGEANGSAMVQPTGGTAPYDYAWNNGMADSIIENLIIGNYGITVSDISGCADTIDFEIMQPDMLTISSVTTELNCFNDFSGAIDLTISGGTPSPAGNYIYTWNSGQFTEDIDLISAGEYEVTILDDNGCELIENIIVEQPDAIIVENEINNVNCFAGSDGSIILSVNGGISPYIYEWENGVTTAENIGLPIGNYTSTVTDNNGCSLIVENEITQPEFIAVEYQIQRAGCKSDEDGSIDLMVAGGVPEFIFNWSNGTVAEDARGLSAGTYEVTVTDDNGCTMSQSLTVGESGGRFNAHFLAASGLFDVDSVEVTSDDIIQFVDVSEPTPTGWEWFFGDPGNSTSNLPNPAFSYPDDETAEQTSYLATLVASNLFCTDTITKTIWITNNFRLNAPKEDSLVYLTFKDVLAYPNPTNGIVNLNIQLSREEEVDVYVVDMLGQILEARALKGKDEYFAQFDFAELLPGLYFINLRSVNQVHTVKIVVAE